MKRFIAAILLSITMCFGLISTGTISPASAVATDCSQTAYLGDRICLDPTTGYGPLVQIFTPGGTYWNAFPVTLYNWNASESAANQPDWFNYGSQGIITAANTPGYGIAFVGAYYGNNPIALTNNGTYISWLQWFTYDPSYPTMEFVIVT